MSDPLARAREIHEAATEGPWQADGLEIQVKDIPARWVAVTRRIGRGKRDASAIAFVHNTYAALLDAVEALKGASHLHHSDFTEEQEQEMAVNPFFDLWEAGKAVCPACDALATLEARIKVETEGD